MSQGSPAADIGQGSAVSQGEKSAGQVLVDNSVNQNVNNNVTVFSNTNMSTADMLSLQSSGQGMNGLSSAQSVNPMGEGQDVQKMMEKLIQLMMMMMIMSMMQKMAGGNA